MTKNIIGAVIGMGIGQKHLEAIEGYKNSYVKIICEKNEKKIHLLKKKFPKKIITKNENQIFSDKDINLISIASHDNFHFSQISKGIKSGKNLVIEKPMCLNLNQLKKISNLLKKNKRIQITSNLVLRVNSLFKHFKRNKVKKRFFILKQIIFGVVKKNFLDGDQK